MHMSRLALERLTKPWEEFVAYPYDDKVPKVDGKYPEWQGGPARGTITIGYGHTDAAGAPRIAPGMRVSQAMAETILAADIAPCERAVAELVTVPLGQHQFDTLVDAVFNFGAGTLARSTLLKRLNAGDYDAVPAELMKFVYSKGERMLGLVHRRQAEIALWNMPDGKPGAAPTAPADHGLAATEVFCPKGDLPPRRSPLDSKTVAAGGTGILATLSLALQSATAPIAEIEGQLRELGLWDAGVAFAGAHRAELTAALVIALFGFTIWDRVRHLRAEQI